MRRCVGKCCQSSCCETGYSWLQLKRPSSKTATYNAVPGCVLLAQGGVPRTFVELPKQLLCWHACKQVDAAERRYWHCRVPCCT